MDLDKAPGIALLSMVIFAAGCEFGQSFQLREWEAQLAEASSQVLASWLTGSNEDLHSICGTSPVAEEDLLIEEIRTAEAALGKLLAYRYERISASGSQQGLHSVHLYYGLDFENKTNVLGVISYDVQNGEPLTDYVNSIDVQPREGFGRIPNYLSLRCIRHRSQQGLDLPERYRTPDGSRDGVHGGATGGREDR